MTGNPPTDYSPALRDMLQRHVKRGDVPGGLAVLGDVRSDPAVIAVGRRWGDVSPLDDEAGKATSMDGTEIMRIQSMTKAVTAVAALRLVDREVVGLDESVAPWVPELADPRVLRTPTSALDDTVAANSPITVRHLLSNASGYGMVLQDCELQRAMANNDTEAGPLPDESDASQWLSRLADLPLAFHPGSGWRYHHSFGILGILISRLAGCSLHDYLLADLFGPLGMSDTGMWVSPQEAHRLIPAYRHDEEDLVELEPAGGGPQAGPPLVDVSHGELVSTIEDYWRFVQALATNRLGENQRLLIADHYRAMLTDQVPTRLKTAESFFPGFWDGMGWGFGVAIEIEGPRRGRYGWSGGLGTDFFVDTDGIAGILFTQVEMGERAMPMLETFQSISR